MRNLFKKEDLIVVSSFKEGNTWSENLVLHDIMQQKLLEEGFMYKVCKRFKDNKLHIDLLVPVIDLESISKLLNITGENTLLMLEGNVKGRRKGFIHGRIGKIDTIGSLHRVSEGTAKECHTYYMDNSDNYYIFA